MNANRYLFALLLSLISMQALAGDSVAGGDASVAQDERDRLTRATMGGSLAAVVLYGYGLTDWWKQGFTGQLRVADEGWFGRDTYAGGADKLGHVYGAYASTRLLAGAYRGYGHDPGAALRLAATTSFGALLLVEFLDGYSREYSFSKEDVVMNGVGVGMAMLFENSAELDRLLDFRLQYWPSATLRRNHAFKPSTDYSGQTYLLVAKASAIPALQFYRPLRYLEFAVGYGTRGYRPDEGPDAIRSRNLYYGISLNLSEILNDTVFRKSEYPRARSATATVLEYIQVPGTAALGDRAF